MPDVVKRGYMPSDDKEFIDQIENKTIDPELRKAIDAIVEEEIHE